MRILLRSDSDDTNFGSESELPLFGSTDFLSISESIYLCLMPNSAVAQ